MSFPLRHSVLAAAFAASLATAPTAGAAPAVFGGTTKASEAIVLRADAKARSLKSAVVSWMAACDSGSSYPVAVDLKAVAGEPGFASAPTELKMSRNRGGRFSGSQVAGESLSDGGAGIIAARLAGRMTARKASGTLDAEVTVVDDQGTQQDTCRTGTVKWSATRARGRVFGGATSQGEPIVIRLDQRRRRVADVLLGWSTSNCQPPGYARFPEQFGNFPIKSGRFGSAFSHTYALDDGSKRTFNWDLDGRVAAAKARGTLRVTVSQTDAGGAQALACDTGSLNWTAQSG